MIAALISPDDFLQAITAGDAFFSTGGLKGRINHTEKTLCCIRLTIFTKNERSERAVAGGEIPTETEDKRVEGTVTGCAIPLNSLFCKIQTGSDTILVAHTEGGATRIISV